MVILINEKTIIITRIERFIFSCLEKVDVNNLEINKNKTKKKDA